MRKMADIRKGTHTAHSWTFMLTTIIKLIKYRGDSMASHITVGTLISMTLISLEKRDIRSLLSICSK